jgi:hypothetical protein
MIVPVIVRREVMNICLATETELFESPDITQFDFCLWGWMKTEIYKRMRKIACLPFWVPLPA